MENPNKDFNHDGDWEERSDQFWNEFDWKRFLDRHEEELARFTALYLKHQNDPNHLDAVAHLMGWDADEWSSADFSSEDASTNASLQDDDDDDDGEPYTLHRHPVYVVSRGLCIQLVGLWESYYEQQASHMTIDAVWKYARSLSALEQNLTLGVQSLDLADFALSVAQLKLALKSINDCFVTLDGVAEGKTMPGQVFLKESRQRLFDLREIALRVMNDCRIEMTQTGGADSDTEELD